MGIFQLNLLKGILALKIDSAVEEFDSIFDSYIFDSANRVILTFFFWFRQFEPICTEESDQPIRRTVCVRTARVSILVLGGRIYVFVNNVDICPALRLPSILSRA